MTKENKDKVKIKSPINESNDLETESDDSEQETHDNTQIDSRLQKSVNMLINLTKVEPEKLKGLTLEEQFDRLSFLRDNLPKKRKEKNKPVIGMPINADAPKFGSIQKEGGKDIWYFKHEEWLNQPKK